MIDIKALLENEEYRKQYEQDLKNRGLKGSEVKDILFRIESCNTSRKIFVNQADAKKAEQNQLESKIAQLKKEKKDISELMNRLRQLSQEVKDNRSEAKKYEEDLRRFLLEVPNHCHKSIPIGHSAEDNKEIHKWPGDNVGKSKKENAVKTHDKLGEELDILDFERGAKVSGARFTFIKGQGALLERALVQFMLDLHTKEHGYTEISPPYMVKGQALLGTGQLPKFEKDLFKIQNSDSNKDRGISYSGESEQTYFLIPTAEVPVTNYFAGEILKESDLPQSFVAFTPCFRSEAGSYGKDVTGLIRQHQFLKVELVKFTHPDKSYEELERLTSHAEEVLKRLELPFRKMLLCTGDIGFGAAKCYDLEVWLPSQGEYREVSSCSNYEAFQARRANIRFKSAKKPQFVHTLNGSGLAVGRTLLAILENYQNKDGSVSIPKVLQPYMNGQKKIEK